VSAIELRALRKRYPPRDTGGAPQDLWQGLDLTVDQGEFVAIEGQSGSGKSTLLHVVGGLDRDYQGEVLVLGERLRALSDSRLAALRHARIGFIFQSFNLLAELTALENVLLPDYFGDGVPEAARRARESLDRVGLADKASARPTALSGGERQRVAIARALLSRPLLLLADEPTGNLDARTGEGIIGLFRELHREGMTLLVVTHEVRVSRAASRVLVLREGALFPDPRLEGSA
jgi:putative ABC transport system ATP-binding protein